ncbi:MAG TPA: hypothetical protein VKU00_10680 [Chthonomonadaceae bacterium]|nr:hypothetical protein [Chthonomonadaceae bacterium]
MSRPFRITCLQARDVPSAERIQELVTEEQHLVLEFPPPLPIHFDDAAVVRALSRRLPDLHAYTSGSATHGLTLITIKKRIAEPVVRERVEALTEAARQFGHTAYDLMTRLADQLGCPLDAFRADASFWRRAGVGPTGEMDGGWKYFFHGSACGFGSRKTGQVIEVQLGFEGEFGVLEPWAFFQYLASTREHEALARLLKDGYDHTRQALEILARLGYLKVVEEARTRRRGWIPAEGRGNREQGTGNREEGREGKRVDGATSGLESWEGS